MTEPFDRVVLVEDAITRELTPAQFLALPLSRRIRAVLDRTVTFFRGSIEVDRDVALDAMRRARATS